MERKIMESDKIIIEPIVTEKSNKFKEEKKYIFKVNAQANKFQIKKALRDLFGVHCLECRIINVKSKPKRRPPYRMGGTATWKKAIVKLAPTETIDIFEGA
jgi:large subunit ribosomal protein L23